MEDVSKEPKTKDQIGQEYTFLCTNLGDMVLKGADLAEGIENAKKVFKKLKAEMAEFETKEKAEKAKQETPAPPAA